MSLSPTKNGNHGSLDFRPERKYETMAKPSVLMGVSSWCDGCVPVLMNVWETHHYPTGMSMVPSN